MWKEVTGVWIREGYGLSETGPILTLSRHDKEGVKLGYIGLPIQKTIMRVADKSGKILPIGEVGEI